MAFFDIDYGGLPGGVFTAASPPEALHALENGIMLHALKEVFSTILSPKQCRLIDQLVQKVGPVPFLELPEVPTTPWVLVDLLCLSFPPPPQPKKYSISFI